MTDAQPSRCIRCGPEGRTDEPSDEHVFPYAIGGGITFPDMCKPCNDVLGAKFDAPLVDHFMIQMKRHRFGIASRNGHVPDPLGVPGHATDDPHVRLQLRPKGGLRILPKKTRTLNSDGSETRTLMFDQREQKASDEAIRKIAQRSLQRGQQTRLLATTTRKIRPRLEITRTMPLLDWTFGLIKIAYELAYIVAGAAWLNDEIAARLRSFLRQDEPTVKHLASANIEAAIAGFGTGRELQRWDGFEDWNHYGSVIHESGRLVAEIRVFETFGAKILVSRNPHAYSVPRTGIGFGLDARSREFLVFNGTKLTVAAPGAGTPKPPLSGAQDQPEEDPRRG